MQMMTWQSATRKQMTWQRWRITGRHLEHRIRGVTQDEPCHAKPSLEQTPDPNDPEGRVHQTAPGQEHSPDDDAFIIPEKRVERDNLHRKLMSTARILKKHKQWLKAA